MKKLVSILVLFSLLTGASTSAFAAVDKYEQGIALIETANIAIDEKIENSVAQADILNKDYLSKIKGIEEEVIFKLEQEKQTLKVAVQSGSYSKSDVNEMERKISELDEQILKAQKETEEKLVAVEQEINQFMELVGVGSGASKEDILKGIQELSADLNIKSQKYATATNVYIKQLDVVIQDCYDVTLVMSRDAIAKAAKKGVLAECSWKLVRFGHTYYWIDPIRVVGRN